MGFVLATLRWILRPGMSAGSTARPRRAPLIMRAGQTVRIACVGDVHDRFGPEDLSALDGLNPDLVLYVGDFGNENLSVVETVLQTRQPHALVFGNHDAWYTATLTGRQNAPYQRDRPGADRVEAQLKMAHDINASYTSIDFPDLAISVVGGRPFSWGGPYWKHSNFYRKYMGVTSADHSGQRICDDGVDTAPPAHSILFLAHNGPKGLGDQAADICGKDFGDSPGGDFGDEDLRRAISHARQAGRKVPLVVFGHMHRDLARGRFGGRRKMCVTEEGTVMVNAAVVPRVVGGARCFTWVEVAEDLGVLSVAEMWADSAGQVLSETTMFSSTEQIRSSAT